MPIHSVFGVVAARAQAAAAISDVSRAGFSINDISVLVPSPTEVTSSTVPESLGLLTGLVQISIPGLGPTVGAGPLLATLAGWSTAGVAHGLVSLRIGERLAHQYEQKIAEGSILIAVQTDQTRDVNRLKAILLQHLAQDVGASGDPRETNALSARASPPPAVIPL